MKKNIFVISENERERILNMHKDAIKRNYLTEAEATIKPVRPANVQQFQEFVRNEKGTLQLEQQIINLVPKQLLHMQNMVMNTIKITEQILPELVLHKQPLMTVDG